jgi:hypothetical protein
MPEQHTKEVKLQPKFRALAFGQKIVPELKISGVWLSANGFQAGSKVEITIAEKQLIIKAL